MKQRPKILFFDIEATNLKADFGYIICIAWKWLGNGNSKVHCVDIMQSPQYAADPVSDKWMLQQFEAAYNEADIVVAHYGSRFDLPYINTRRLYHGLAPLARVPMVDTWRTAKYNLSLHSNRLASITDFFNLPQKTPLRGDIWLRAMSGHGPSIAYVVKHCKADILALEGAYLKLRPLMADHPNVNLITGAGNNCPRCGSAHLVKRGFNIAKARISQRFQCQACGSWSAGSPQSPGARMVAR